MAARFTLASGITSRLDAFSDYISTFSKRSLSLLILLTVTISVCFLYSSQSPNLLSTTTDGFRFGHNESHLLSAGTYDCARCEQPPNLAKLEPKQIWEACLDPGVVPEYYMTVVMVARNDDYAGNQFHRLQNAIDSTYALAEKTKTLIELLIIEWNPPAGRRGIRDTYRYRRSKYLTYRIITVPRKIHETLRGKEGPEALEYEGKNVGIRFARGEFIVCTNQDDIWSPNMHNAVVSRSFRKKMFYTQYQDSHVSYDELPGTIVDVPSFTTDDGLLESCSFDAYEPHAFAFPAPQVIDTTNFLVIAHEASDFTLAHRDTWQMTRGYREAGAKTWIDMELVLTAAWTLDIPVTYTRDTLSCHQQHHTVVHPNSDADNRDVDVGRMMSKEEIHMNEEGQWGLQNVKIWENGLHCEVFRGGLGV
ncbi:hypothetical protein BDB00DRAFT_798980 [Zychaea mexicana]|uniref:uncharacterized protein n=1 Tax=Zychaea mexicana TaxID=64656 RepID=UPI0022FE8058|nr:uncharacterized protein BDB00DRAFT_798980 [Zychaea mexicana]KAI9498657.1 hypothetical protein BDB00DRAFT_798980 [Zychaea mexicana]